MSIKMMDIQINKTAAHSPQRPIRPLNESGRARESKDASIAVGSASAVKEENIKQAIARMGQMAGLFNRRISYNVDERTDQLVVKIIDRDTEEVIRQIPPQELLNLAAKFEEMKGLIFNDTG